MAPHSNKPQSEYSDAMMSVLWCWNLDMRHAMIKKAAPIEKGTGKIDVEMRELDSVVLVELL